MSFDPDHTPEGVKRREQEMMWDKLKGEKTASDHCDNMLKLLSDMEKNIDILIKIYQDKVNGQK